MSAEESIAIELQQKLKRIATNQENNGLFAMSRTIGGEDNGLLNKCVTMGISELREVERG